MKFVSNPLEEELYKELGRPNRFVISIDPNNYYGRICLFFGRVYNLGPDGLMDVPDERMYRFVGFDGDLPDDFYEDPTQYSFDNFGDDTYYKVLDKDLTKIYKGFKPGIKPFPLLPLNSEGMPSFQIEKDVFQWNSYKAIAGLTYQMMAHLGEVENGIHNPFPSLDLVAGYFISGLWKEEHVRTAATLNVISEYQFKLITGKDY